MIFHIYLFFANIDIESYDLYNNIYHTAIVVVLLFEAISVSLLCVSV